ncbi:MAG: hypothetical protein IPN29_21575 [Saprospiraceae bacterium]|nr:hypothetical protein [Saprospiraceae bacterium]
MSVSFKGTFAYFPFVNMDIKKLYILVLCFAFSCKESVAPIVPVLQEIPLTTIKSGNANLTTGEDGHMYLTWLEYINDSLVELRLARLMPDARSWEDLGVVQGGTDWFVNWADFPSVINFAKDKFMAHWLQYSGDGTYEYDILTSFSDDGGKLWSNPAPLNDTTVNSEYGFVTLKANAGGVFAVWLDGRNMTGDHDDHAGSHGAMNLRSVTLDGAGKRSEETVLDDKTCECCNTAVAMTSTGPIVFYRDKSNEGIRDIHYTRLVNGEWIKDKTLNQDNWAISGCPVNGPAADAGGNYVASVWYTEAGDRPAVQLAVSGDGGKSFGSPILVSQDSTLGRVDVVVDEKSEVIYVSYLEKTNSESRLMLVQYNLEGQKLRADKIAPMSAARKSGFPRMAMAGGKLMVVYTDVDGVKQRVRTVKII